MMSLTYTQTNKIMDINRIEEQIYDMAVRSGMFVPINGRTFRFKKYMIVHGPDDRWNVFLLPRKTLIANTFLKVSAFAIAKLHDAGKSSIMNRIEQEDARFQKNYLDSLFYKNTMKVSKDVSRKDTALWRFEIVNQEVKGAKSQIDAIFYSSLT
jgi:hypothetical protein